MDVEDLRLAVYRHFAETGRAPEIGADMRPMLDELARQRHVVLDGDGNIVMAHPFAAIPLGFSVMGRATLWWGGCCWDSFALPFLLADEPDVLVASRCPGCDRPGAWIVDRGAPPVTDWVAHFLIPVSHMWDDVVHTCAHQRLFCSEACVDTWCERAGTTRGYVMDAGTLWRLASRWYEGRLGRGYIRRDPAAAAAYFAEVGLTGPFWTVT